MATKRQKAQLEQARALYERGDYAATETICREIVKHHRDDVNAWSLLGLASNRCSRFEQAEAHFERCVRLRPEEPMAHCQLARARMFQGRFDDALAGFERALALDAAFPAAIRGKTEVMDRSGRRDEAYAFLSPRADTASPELTLLHAELTEKVGKPEEAIDIAGRCLAGPGVQPATRRRLLFVVARAQQRLDRIDDAFESYRRANLIGARPFDVQARRRLTDRLIELFGPERGGPRPRAAETSELPVLIVGMPRSGSTLVEQIIATHPRAAAGGEPGPRRALHRDPRPHRVAAAVPGLDRGSPARGRGPPRPALSQAARTAPAAEAARIADKNLANHELLGLVSLLVPRARVIHCRRHPLDNGLSCFITDLSPVGHPWSTDLRSIGLYFRECERLMRHWREVLDLAILEVSYETLVAEQERVSREIIDFCGLEWDDACLRLHASGRAVTTLSYDQVRRPIYRSAIGRYERFEPHLGPLKGALEEGTGEEGTEGEEAQ